MKKDMKQLIEYIFFKKIWLLVHVSPPEISHLLGKVLFLLFKIFVNTRYKILISNLKLAFPEKSCKEIQSLSTKVWENIWQTFVEFVNILGYNIDNVLNYVEIENEELIRKYKNDKVKPLLITGHIGNWEMMCMALAKAGYPVAAVVQDIKNKYIDRVIKKVRESSGGALISRTNSIEYILKYIQEGYYIIILIDQRLSYHGVKVNFFSHTATTTPIAGILARRYNLPVILLHSYREKYKLRIKIGPQITFHKSNNIQKDITWFTQILTNYIEIFIKEHPEQWFWLHNRWKM
jgi:KDO2-lipid IV(A) lauroyltransferase